MVLQLCGRVCRRLSLWNPSFLSWGSFFIGTPCSQARFVAFLYGTPISEKIGFFFIGTTCRFVRFVAFASPVRLTPRVFCFRIDGVRLSDSVRRPCLPAGLLRPFGFRLGGSFEKPDFVREATEKHLLFWLASFLDNKKTLITGL